MPDSPSPPPLIGQAPAFLAMLAHVSRVAAIARPVLVVGERGTGKELVAARLHYLSRRWDRPFVKVNCAALPESLLDSALFGHEAGAFTGAMRRHLGRLEQADGGTLFLDEIATASGAVQEKLLRAVEYGEVERVGGRTVGVDVRVIGATNADLPALAAAGRFRADLLDRLAFDVIALPPLRERVEDIALLATHFAIAMTSELERPCFAGFTKGAEGALLAHDWPGNVRELRNAVERSVAATPAEAAVATIILDPFPPSPPPPPPPSSARPPGVVAPPAPAGGSLSDRVFAFEAELLASALERNHHNQRRTAEDLGLGYHQLRGQLKKHGLLPRNNRGAGAEGPGRG